MLASNWSLLCWHVFLHKTSTFSSVNWLFSALRSISCWQRDSKYLILAAQVCWNASAANYTNDQWCKMIYIHLVFVWRMKREFTKGKDFTFIKLGPEKMTHGMGKKENSENFDLNCFSFILGYCDGRGKWFLWKYARDKNSSTLYVLTNSHDPLPLEYNLRLPSSHGIY